MRKGEWLDRTADTMLTATHSAGSVVKATVATAREATMQIAVRGLVSRCKRPHGPRGAIEV